MNVKIYCITDYNGLNYVGQTTRTLSWRLHGHKCDKKRYISKEREKCCSSQKLDLDNCEIKLIEQCDHNIAKEREKYWINKIDCVNIKKLNGYCKEKKRQYHFNNRERILKYQKIRAEKNKKEVKVIRDYRNTWGGDTRYHNNLLQIDVNIFIS